MSQYSKHSIEEAIAKLRTKRVRVGKSTDEITGASFHYVNVANSDYLGIKLLGYVDFLVNHHNYRLIK